MRYISAHSNILDIILLLITFPTLIYAFVTGGNSTCNGVLAVFLIYCFKPFFSVVKPIRSIFTAVLESLPSLVGTIFSIFCMFYIWSILGIEIFHGYMADTTAIQDTDYVKLHYEKFGFEHFSDALAVCWLMLIVNNWHIIHLGYAAATGSQAVKLFFIPFWVLNNLFILNIVLACLMEALLLQWELQSSREAQKLSNTIAGKMERIANQLHGSSRTDPHQGAGGEEKPHYIVKQSYNLVKVLMRLGSVSETDAITNQHVPPSLAALLTLYPDDPPTEVVGAAAAADAAAAAAAAPEQSGGVELTPVATVVPPEEQKKHKRKKRERHHHKSEKSDQIQPESV
eukprot:TRINITY_DN726_c0_g1_i2.p1 TRINITY_DN726_c0_g1~~TRINITY_DN726_c0_g1_i2.p1  ORF type:complete len:342 (-),score=85.56 TRINITY_DN726_c0_g1_i2:23-1048(-)